MNLIRIVVAVLSMSCSCLGQSAREIARVAFKSVVLLEMNDSNDRPLCFGSGFFVADGIIATNAHVIEGASSGTAKLIDSAQKMQILGAVAVDGHADLALLKVAGTAPSLSLGPTTNPAVGDSVYVVGNPLGLEGTFSEGIISSVRSVESGSLLQMTAPISPGSSGGPVMDASSAVIGIAVGTFQDGQNLNLAVPVSYLSRLLALTPKALIPLGQQAKRNESEKSMLSGVGARIESAVTVSSFTISYGGDYEFRLSNNLPADVSNIKLCILYSDVSGAPMDFEEFTFAGTVLAGLTKTVEGTSESSKAKLYYITEHIRQFPNSVAGVKTSRDATRKLAEPIDPKYVELRVVSFTSEGPK